MPCEAAVLPPFPTILFRPHLIPQLADGAYTLLQRGSYFPLTFSTCVEVRTFRLDGCRRQHIQNETISCTRQHDRGKRCLRHSLSRAQFDSIVADSSGCSAGTQQGERKETAKLMSLRLQCERPADSELLQVSADCCVFCQLAPRHHRELFFSRPSESLAHLHDALADRFMSANTPIGRRQTPCSRTLRANSITSSSEIVGVMHPIPTTTLVAESA